MKHESSSALNAEQSATQGTTWSTTFSTSFPAQWSSTGFAGSWALKSQDAAKKTFTAGSIVKMTLTMSLLAIVTIANAQETGLPISTDRPSFSDGPLIIPKGHWQLEGGYTYTRFGGDSSAETIGELLARFPLSQVLELRVSNFSLGRSTGVSAGLVDPSIGLKWNLQNGDAKRPTLAIVAQSTVPVGASQFRVDRYQPTLKFVWYQQSDSNTGFGGNLIVSDLGSSDARFTQFAASVYVSETLNPLTGAFLEIYGLGPLSKDGPNGAFVDTGVTYLLNPRTQVDFRIGTGFDPKRDGWFMGAGISYRF